MTTILSIIGTRPEAIKMAPVLKQLRLHPAHVRSVVCSTGQHRELLNQVLDLFKITPDYTLDIMQPDQTLADISARLFTGLDRVVREVKPDWVLALGDTTSVMVASLVAFYHGVPFGHVEAGLRTDDKQHPFPEEINRRVADLVADIFFAPSTRARDRLLAEGAHKNAVHVTGNTAIDALQLVAAEPYDWSAGPLAELPRHARFVLVTTHRREIFGPPLKEICRAIRDLEETLRGENICIVLPVHPNPNVQKVVREQLTGLPGVRLIDPLDYHSLVQLMKRCELVLTDSGGIQEEAPSLGVPVLVLRDTCERPEDVERGVVRLVGTNRKRIFNEAKRLLLNPAERSAMAAAALPGEDGKAAERIVSILLEKSGPAEKTEKRTAPIEEVSTAEIT